MSRSCRKAGWLFAEFGADTAGNSLERLVADLKASGHAAELLRDPAEQAKLWRVRRDGLPATAKLPEWPETYEGWEDSAVPHEKLGSYLREFKLLLHAHGYESSVYGHFGDGLVHCRIDFDLRTEEGIQNWQSFLKGLPVSLCVTAARCPTSMAMGSRKLPWLTPPPGRCKKSFSTILRHCAISPTAASGNSVAPGGISPIRK
jgi:hypothetical protein